MKTVTWAGQQGCHQQHWQLPYIARYYHILKHAKIDGSDRALKSWQASEKNSNVAVDDCSKDVRLPVQMQRAMAAEAEAAREAKAKVWFRI